jgi:glucose/arabinose dehydrogenase
MPFNPCKLTVCITTTMHLRFAQLLITIAALGCGRPPSGKGAGEVEKSAVTEEAFRVETVVTGLEVPWAIVWTPDGRMLFTERAGRVRVFENGKLKPEPFFTVTDVEPTGESGLMDISLHPQFATNHYLYLSYAYKGDGQRVRVIRYRENGTTLVDPKVIIEVRELAQGLDGFIVPVR